MMEDIVLPQKFEGLEQLPQNKQHLSLFQSVLSAQHFLKRTSIALLIDIIEVASSSQELMTFNNIRMGVIRPNRNRIEGDRVEISSELL